MDSFASFLLVFSLLFSLLANGNYDVPFQQNYNPLWGYDHTKVLDESREIQLTLDQYSGSGFQSWQKYGSGWFNMRIKTPQKDSTAVITTFYLQSDAQGHRDEIDFEFLGGNGSKDHPYLLQTNIYTNGRGGREQGIFLWFDPTADFHDYTILWNHYQTVFFVDRIPIRVFKNATKYGGAYPTKAMNIFATIWTGTWASHGMPVNWTDAPFEAHYRGFDITACNTHDNNEQDCLSNSKFWWNQKQYWSLNSDQQEAYENVRSKYLYYDYCTKPNYPECKYNQ
ncbi:hypothetical protein L6164_016855 [Bauhinia variegata]|uniref:Uncharacterized protein n=1 Tax=Bauhinia variegata TaxID=167791 RepID=A0ACB9N7M1_BAUVA|nr:hypothetical protein L6164_016855 [Bauhinia variegata]